MTVVPPPPRSKVKLRRSQRVVISIPITISADSAGRQLTEDTHTLVINAHGALIAFSGDLTLGQQFQLRNRLTTEELACKIVHVGPKVEGKTQVGVEFLQPALRFWHIAFPPEDWNGVISE